MSDNLNLERYAHEANEYFNDLAETLGHPGEQRRSLILWRAVMHSVRDRIHLAESLHLISSLPIILKGLYVEQWQYTGEPPLEYDSIEELEQQVESVQASFGETEFPWGKSTAELFEIVLNSLKKYLGDGQMDHIRTQMPQPVQRLIP